MQPCGGLFYRGSNDIGNNMLNSAILASTSIMKPILASASEADISMLFDNCKKATILHTTLAEMGWPQPATAIQTDNSTACGIANNIIKLQQSCVDMRFYWVCDCSKQGHFHIFWKPGTANFANFFTKHHAARHHQLMRPVYLHEKKASAAIAIALPILHGFSHPADGEPNPMQSWSHRKDSAKRKPAHVHNKRHEASLRIRAFAHS
jgi:hypothetical protein